jgi:hypothetical protein
VADANAPAARFSRFRSSRSLVLSITNDRKSADEHEDEHGSSRANAVLRLVYAYVEWTTLKTQRTLYDISKRKKNQTKKNQRNSSKWYEL